MFDNGEHHARPYERLAPDDSGASATAFAMIAGSTAAATLVPSSFGDAIACDPTTARDVFPTSLAKACPVATPYGVETVINATLTVPRGERGRPP